MNREVIYRAILDNFGNNAQTIVAIEELSELQKVLCKYLRGSHYFDKDTFMNNLTEELADVSIMLEQIKMIFGCQDCVESKIDEKLQRTIDRYLSK